MLVEHPSATILRAQVMGAATPDADELPILGRIHFVVDIGGVVE